MTTSRILDHVEIKEIVLLFILSSNLYGVDTIFLGGNILTMDDERPSARALAVDRGRIVSIGSEKEVLKLRRHWTQIIDIRGGTLMPGFIEAHCHPIAGAMLSQLVDVSGFTHGSRSDVLDTIREAVSVAVPGEWVFAFGWDPIMVKDLDNPTLAELDQISLDVPIFILTQMAHMAFINSAGYRNAGITRETPEPPGAGKFQKDVDGELNGVVYEVSAIQYVINNMPKTPRGTIELLLNLQYGKFAKAGYTTISVLGPVNTAGYPLGFISGLSHDPSVPVRTNLYVLPDQFDIFRGHPERENPNFRVNGVKLYMDGSPYTGGAAFSEPYLNTELTIERMGLKPDHVGQVNYTDQEITDLIAKYHTDGFQIAVHSQGERALDLLLDSFDRVFNEHPRPDHRHRLEHNALITRSQMERAQRLGITLSFFIDHIYYYGTSLEHIVGKDRLKRYMPIGSAIHAGHRPSIHTDNPATPIGPFRPIRTAVTRKTRDTGTIIGADERISIDDALKAVTINAAWQLFEEKERGSIEIGKAADLVLLSQNPKAIDPEQLDQIKVLSTWINGKWIDTSPFTWMNIKLGLLLAYEFLKTQLKVWLSV